MLTFKRVRSIEEINSTKRGKDEEQDEAMSATKKDGNEPDVRRYTFTTPPNNVSEQLAEKLDHALNKSSSNKVPMTYKNLFPPNISHCASIYLIPSRN